MIYYCISINKKVFCLTCYNYFIATYNRNITNKDLLHKLYTVHYKSLNSVSNFIHLRLIDYLNFFAIVTYHDYHYN